MAKDVSKDQAVRNIRKQKKEVGEKELVNHDIKVYVYLLYFKIEMNNAN